jgi:hypothetical protein
MNHVQAVEIRTCCHISLAKRVPRTALGHAKSLSYVRVLREKAKEKSLKKILMQYFMMRKPQGN